MQLYTVKKMFIQHDGFLVSIGTFTPMDSHFWKFNGVLIHFTFPMLLNTFKNADNIFKNSENDKKQALSS